MYATYEDYIQFFGEDITSTEFQRYSIEAERALDIATTGIDNVKKLKTAFPSGSAKEIVYCACVMCHTLKQVSDAEAASGYVAGANGMQGKAVASMSAGNESISYTSGQTAINEAVFNTAKKRDLLVSTAKTYLSGLEDANGVNLLYMGAYPNV